MLYRLRWALLATLAIAGVATVGYVVTEGYGWLDALYMTVITLGTVGYGEVHPLGTSGRLLTIALIVVGFATFVYVVSILTNLFLSGDALAQIRHRRSKRMLDQVHDHVIVVGYGRVGQAVVRGIQELGKQCVVIDRNAEYGPAIQAVGCVEVIGDGTNQDDLDKAGISRADGLVAACDADSENLVVVLTARSMSSDLRIISRVNEAAWIERITQAGADVVQSPYRSYGMSLASAAASPTVLETHDLPALGLGTEEILIPAGSPLIGSTPGEISQQHEYAYVVGLRRDDRLRPWHTIDGAVRAGDVLVALGTPEHLRALAGSAASTTPREVADPTRATR